MSNSSILAIDRTQSGATNPGRSSSGSYGNESVLRISQRSSNTEASPSDFLNVFFFFFIAYQPL